eukprot:gene20810-27646_t
MASATEPTPSTSSAPDIAIEGKTVKHITLGSVKRAYDLFAGNHGESIPADEDSQRLKIAIKIRDEYASAQHMVAPQGVAKPEPAAPAAALGPGRAPATVPAPALSSSNGATVARPESKSSVSKIIDTVPMEAPKHSNTQGQGKD